MAMMLTDPSLHTSFLNHGGLERILEELRENVKTYDLICSVGNFSFKKKTKLSE